MSDPLGPQGPTDQPGRLGHLVCKGSQVNLGNLDNGERKAKVDYQESMASRDKPVSRALLGPRVHRDTPDPLVSLAKLDSRANQASPEKLVYLVRMVWMAFQELMEPQGPAEVPGQMASLAKGGQRVKMDLLAPEDPLGREERLVYEDRSVWRGRAETEEFRENEERMED